MLLVLRGDISVFDALVIGSGPAGLNIAASLCTAGLRVLGLSPNRPDAAWLNTYGIWSDELEPLGLTDLLAHRWANCVSYAGQRKILLQREYALFDKRKLQTHLLSQCEQGKMAWHKGLAATVEHLSYHSCVTTQDGTELTARVVIDASGHSPALIQRPAAKHIAYQAAYGIVGRFSAPPVEPNQCVLMDYRADHLTPAERLAPPTFLYGMDLGNDVYFVEETSLAHSPAISFDVLKQRLHQRLAFMGIQVNDVHEVEHCLFPMNLPLPDLRQPVVGFGGSASMVHPASGYLVGAMLRRAPAVAQAISQALDSTHSSPSLTAQAAWQALWNTERVQKHYLYLFGLQNLMRFEEHQLHDFFATFFCLPQSQWAGFLADTLSMPEMLGAMLHLFGQAPNHVRRGLVSSVGRHGNLLWHAFIR